MTAKVHELQNNIVQKLIKGKFYLTIFMQPYLKWNVEHNYEGWIRGKFMNYTKDSKKELIKKC